MEINRNQYFMFGIILLALGLQLRVVDSFVLNEEATRFIAERTGNATASATTFLPISTPFSRKVVRPPQWLGWMFISIGAVLSLHSLALKQPGG